MDSWLTILSNPAILNEVPEHMAQEWHVHTGGLVGDGSSMKFLSTWLRNSANVSHSCSMFDPQ